jgi:uroporphyrinogen-III synthase
MFALLGEILDAMSLPDPTAIGLSGLRVATFEARMTGSMAALIRKQGGEPVEAPALREVPIGDNPAALAFADALIAGEFDLVIFLTGVGTRYLAREIETKYPREQWVEALNRAKVAIRGPKPVAPLRELGARIDLQAPEPNTWRDLLTALDANIPVKGLRVAVQEYGQPAPELIRGLEDRGATVTCVPVYGWALPEDTGPLIQAIGEIAEGRIGAVAFTSAQQVVHLLQVAKEQGREAELREALARSVVVASVGPTTTEALKAHGLPVDIEPEHPKMGHLVVALANGWRGVGKARLPA